MLISLSDNPQDAGYIVGSHFGMSQTYTAGFRCANREVSGNQAHQSE